MAKVMERRMSQRTKPRTVQPKRMLTLGTVMVSIAGSGAVATPTHDAWDQLCVMTGPSADHFGVLIVAGEGEGAQSERDVVEAGADAALGAE